MKQRGENLQRSQNINRFMGTHLRMREERHNRQTVLFNKMRTCMACLCLFLLAAPSTILHAQDDFDLSIGFGFPELLNVSGRLQLEQAQIGLYVGIAPWNTNLFSVGAEAFLHFAGRSYLSFRKPWYVRIGFSYIRHESEYAIDHSGTWNIRVGGDINFSNRIGMTIDAGVMILVFDEQIEKKPQTGWKFKFDIDIPVFPTAGIGFFLRI